MKTTRIFGAILAAWFILGLGPGISLSLAGEAKKADTAPSKVQQQEGYQMEIESKLKELNRELQEWKAKSKELEEKARSELEEQINNLSKKEEEVSKKLKELKTKTGKAWEDLKAGLDSAMEDLGKAFDQVRSQFKS
jgi:Skp family chaperone for outer membrane proteins